MTNIKDRVLALIRPEVRQMNAYHVADAQGMIKLDAMENPYSLTTDLNRDWLEHLKEAPINRYPPPNPQALIEKISQQFQLPNGQQMMLGNGSDELIQILMLAVAGADKKVLVPEPGFVMYSVSAVMTGMQFIGVQRRADFSLDMDALLSAIQQHQPALIFLASPNNPTGNVMTHAELDQILELADGLVIVDEAYTIFAKDNHIRALGRYDNLLILRTLSKFGLAGLRLGMLMGAAEWIQELHKVRMPYNVNILTQMSVSFFIDKHHIFQQQAELIISERNRVQDLLQNMSGVDVFPSEANFLCFRLRQHSADDVFSQLKQNGILIKNLHASHQLLENCLRVTIGTAKENDLFLSALTKIIE